MSTSVENELRVAYQILCGASFWLRSDFVEGHDVMLAVKSEIRAIESVLGFKDYEKAILDLEPIEPRFIAELRKTIETMSTQKEPAENCEPSAKVPFTYDKAKDVIRLGDGSEIQCRIVDRIDYEREDEHAPTDGYRIYRPGRLDAIIHIKNGWLWRGLREVRASDYV